MYGVHDLLSVLRPFDPDGLSKAYDVLDLPDKTSPGGMSARHWGTFSRP